MTSPQIKIFISLAAVSLVYAFLWDIRISRKASKLANWLQKECPDLWSEVNSFAQNWKGGLPGLKILYRKHAVDLPGFEQEYGHLRSMERKFLWGVGIGAVCIGLVIAGFRFWGWHW